MNGRYNDFYSGFKFLTGCEIFIKSIDPVYTA